MRRRPTRGLPFLLSLLALLTAVVAMHSMGAGHSGTPLGHAVRGTHGVQHAAQPAPVTAAVLTDRALVTGLSPSDASVRASCSGAPCPGAHAALSVPAVASHLGAICLAVLPVLGLLLLGLGLLSRRTRSGLRALTRPVDLRSLRAAGDPFPRPSLSSLCILRT